MTLSRYLPFLLATLAVAFGLATYPWVGWERAIIIAEMAFFTVYLVLTLIKVPRLTRSYLRKNAASSDAPVLVIFFVTLGTVAAALASLFMVINSDDAPTTLDYVLALLTVPLGWFTIHLRAAIHYAHLFWQPPAGDGKPRRGLEFPGKTEPVGWDFVYFAFVIGMAAQTSDVAVSSRHMRGFVLTHSIASFFFNTVLVAAAVNLAVSLGN